MVYSQEVQHMCVVKKGPNHGPAPIPEEGKWVKAKPEIRGGNVFVSALEGGAAPEGVRYLWTDWAKPDVWLYNSQNTPVFSFKFEKPKK